MIQGSRVRAANAEDLESILAIESASFASDAFSRRQLRYLLTKAKGVVFVAQQANRIVGYISILARAGQKRCRIYSLAVSEDARGQGVADSLIDAAVFFALQAGFKEISLEVASKNLAAYALYSKKGFTRSAVKQAYYANGDDAYRMIRSI